MWVEERSLKHDLEDMIELVRVLEQRIIKLERMIDAVPLESADGSQWYFLYG